MTNGFVKQNATMSRGLENRGRVRIHTIILTKDRPATLARCLRCASASLTKHDALTILDDSGDELTPANAQIISDSTSESFAAVCHLRVNRLHAAIIQASSAECGLWQSKTAARDIAPLRNLELLIANAIGAQTTVLVDDDIHSFDLVETHRCMETHAANDGGAIVGASINGTSEMDTITRLADGIQRLNSDRGTSAGDIFQLDERGSLGSLRCRWVSAGYLAFRFPETDTIAFPPGYNEDWLWCLLHEHQTSVWREGQTVIHDPPHVRQSTREDLRFELSGDLVFDTLSESTLTAASDVNSLLIAFRDCAPDVSSLPTTRAEELLREYRALTQMSQVGDFAVIERNGLSVLRDMLRSGELNENGATSIQTWCADALEKQQSFASTLRNAAVFGTLQKAVEEGVI